ncbi:hypothetical protein GGI17_004108 [Coemansia sp. S146]|nr:hypothetical protein GGI17_004108 [Coemansia sp. S146]
MVLRHGAEQYTGTKAVVFAHDHSAFVNVNVRPMTKDTSDCVSHRKNDIESKMDALIEYYENATMTSSASEVRRQLRARNIFYYDAQKTVSAFDKWSSEGKATIREKQVAKRERLLAQRGYGNNAKRRKLNIGIPNPDFQDN